MAHNHNMAGYLSEMPSWVYRMVQDFESICHLSEKIENCSTNCKRCLNAGVFIALSLLMSLITFKFQTFKHAS